MARLNFDSFDVDGIKAHFSDTLRGREVTLSDAGLNFERVLKVWQMRVAFTERLILLDTGTFALSLTFLASFGSHSAATQAFQSLPAIYTAWGFLLSSIVCGGLHNLLRISSAEHLFLVVGTLFKAYGSEDYVRRMRAFSGMLSGKITPEEGDGFDEIDIGKFFEELGKMGVSEFQKEADTAYSQQKNPHRWFQAYCE